MTLGIVIWLAIINAIILLSFSGNWIGGTAAGVVFALTLLVLGALI